MRLGRPPLSLGQHGKIATENIDGGRFRASTRIRTWDDEVRRVTAIGKPPPKPEPCWRSG